MSFHLLFINKKKPTFKLGKNFFDLKENHLTTKRKRKVNLFMVFQNSTPIFEDTIEEFLPKVLKSIVASAKGRVMAAQTWEHFLGTPCRCRYLI